MITEHELITAVCANPDDDLVRLAYADWLEEHGQSQRADFIRLQVSAARPRADDWYHNEAESRKNALLRAYAAQWLQPFPPSVRSGCRFRRGFVHHISMTTKSFLDIIQRLCQMAPLDSIKLDACNEHIEELARCSHLARFTSLDLSSNQIHTEGVVALAASSYLSNLAFLNLDNNRIGVEGAEALALSPHLANLESLDLKDNYIGDAGVVALAASPHLANLRSLSVAGNGIGVEGVRALAASPHLGNLTSLDLTDNRIGPDGVKALAASPYLTNLSSLHLGGNQIGTLGVLHLAASENFVNLKLLDLTTLWPADAEIIGSEGLETLATSPHLRNLTSLHVPDSRR